MSDYADTIRRLRTAADYEYGRLTPDQRVFYRETADALDALLAENQRLRDALEEITRVWPNRGHAANIARAALAARRVEDEGITPIETAPLLGRDRRRNGEDPSATKGKA